MEKLHWGLSVHLHRDRERGIPEVRSRCFYTRLTSCLMPCVSQPNATGFRQEAFGALAAEYLSAVQKQGRIVYLETLAHRSANFQTKHRPGEKNWLTTHGVRLEDEKCGLGSCLNWSSRTGSTCRLCHWPWSLGHQAGIGINQASCS